MKLRPHWMKPPFVAFWVIATAGVLAGCSDAAPPAPSGTSGAATTGGGSGTGTGGAIGGASSGAGGIGSSANAGGGAGGTGGASAGAGAGGTGGGGGTTASRCAISATDAEQPALLSETGCIDMADPTKPAPGLVPYAVRSPLWSDAAAKERFVRIPEGGKIHVLDCALEAAACKPPGEGGTGEEDGHWQMPVGTVLVKNFSIEGKHIETRLLMRRSTSNLTGWKGFSYEWNDDQTEATLLPDDETGKNKPVGAAAQVWHYPSRGECMECHTRYAGRSLGPSTQQLNSDFTYADGTMNQIDKLQQLGLFDVAPKKLAGYPDPLGEDGTLDERARSYMHTNCAICHRPGGAATTVDMRYTTAFADMKLCDKVERDADKVPDPDLRLVPGKPAESTMSFRMHTLETTRMPKIGSNVVDTAGVGLIDAWISAIPTNACPPQP